MYGKHPRKGSKCYLYRIACLSRVFITIIRGMNYINAICVFELLSQDIIRSTLNNVTIYSLKCRLFHRFEWRLQH